MSVMIGNVMAVALVMGLLLGGVASGADSKEDMFWQSVKKSDVLEEYRVYVEQYPKGNYTGEAWRRIGQLEAGEKSALAAQRKAEKAAKEMRAGKVFRDCPDCPEMVVIPPGSFKMGSNNGYSDEKPVHTVRISRSFALGKTEVTQGQWRAVMGSNPSHFSSCGDDCPVESVNWNEAREYVSKLSQKTGKTYRLPSEAEWEYACRAGGNSTYCGGESIDSVAWYTSNSGSKTHSVAGKQPNAWGLVDMSGNVWEWTEDCWNNSYSGAPTDGSVFTSGDCGERVVRGGSWDYGPAGRAASRSRNGTSVRGYVFGFRPARMLP